MSNNNTYELVVGLEVHAQLMTKSKLFCGDSASFGGMPNTQVSPISLAHPGTLPKLNEKAIELAVKLGLALNCNIERKNYFARKNYFYPDLPKGYQISQHSAPICKHGYLPIPTLLGKKNIILNRIHIEEDAGKSIHDIDDNYTCIDLNRSGVPLLEIVTEPVIHSADEAFTFLTELRKLVRWLDVCDGNMEEGSMRCDANISVRPIGSTTLGKRVEVKNLNSIRNVKKAIEIEFERLIALTENGQDIIQETRSYDADKNITFSLRNKEDAEDYRYFPEPDLPPFIVTENYINKIKSKLPKLPEQIKEDFMSLYQLSDYDAQTICSEKEDIEYFESIIKHSSNYKAIANWMIGPLKQFCKEHDLSMQQFPLSVEKVADLIQFVESGKINFNNASGRIMNAMIENKNLSAFEVANELNLIQESDEKAIEMWVEETLASMPEKVKEYKSGKKGLIGLFSGDVKKRSKGKADMQLVQRLLEEILN